MRALTLALILAAVSGAAMAQSTTINHYDKGRITDIQITRSDGSSFHSRETANRYGPATYSSSSTPAPKPLDGYNPMGADGYHPMGR